MLGGSDSLGVTSCLPVAFQVVDDNEEKEVKSTWIREEPWTVGRNYVPGGFV